MPVSYLYTFSPLVPFYSAGNFSIFGKIYETFFLSPVPVKMKGLTFYNIDRR